MNRVIDASVILAIMLGERGAAEAEAELVLEGSLISTVNLSEIYRKLVDGGLSIDVAVEQVERFRLKSVPFDDAQAAEAARLRPLTRHFGTSFADRACLALARLRDMTVYTADRKWALLELGLDIRLIR